MSANGYVVGEKIEYDVFVLFHSSNFEHPSTNFFPRSSGGF